jgi:hypothetical protein
MTDPTLSAHDIVALLSDSKVIDAGTAHRLETRIIAYGDIRAGEGRTDGIRDCARRAAAATAAIKGASQRAAAQKVVRAVERCLPHGGPAQEEAYLRGVKFGVELQLKRQQQKPDSR